MSDKNVAYPFLLSNGEQPAPNFERGQYDSGLASSMQYELGDLAIVHTDGTVRKATGGGSTLGRLVIVSQDYELDERLLPPGDGTSPHWLVRERGVPLDLIPDEHEIVFTIPGAFTSAQLAQVQAGAEVELSYDSTEGCLVLDPASTGSPNVQMKRLLDRDTEVGDQNARVVCRILSANIRK